MCAFELSRRSVVTGGVLLSIGGLGVGSAVLSEPEFKSGYMTHSLERPVIEDGPKPGTDSNSSSPFFAALLTSRKEAETALRTDVLGDHVREEWESIDYSEEFVAVFISRYFVTPVGTFDGSQPLSSVEDRTLRFEVDTSEVDYRDQETLYTRIERWKRSWATTPKRATVVLRSE